MKTPHIATIEIEGSEMSTPVLINLKELFGCLNLSYRVAVESLGIVETRLLPGEDILKICRSGAIGEVAHTRVAVRAYDEEGDSVLAIFRVVLGSALSFTSEAA